MVGGRLFLMAVIRLLTMSVDVRMSVGKRDSMPGSMASLSTMANLFTRLAWLVSSRKSSSSANCAAYVTINKRHPICNAFYKKCTY